ncbi:hypothetical protein PV773_24770 [Mesorhizobium sp. CC13]|uniref:hypothetical protein n=1 Tax=Mesorhizobium sp. CC13 TaxID=3029194 RepID=UPI00326406BE
MMAELDLLGATPFDASQVHVIFATSNGGCSYHIVKRSTLAPLVDAVRKAGVAVSSLRLETNDGIKIADRHSLRAIFPLTKKERFQRSMWRRAIAILLATAFGTYTHALWRLEAADDQLGAQMAEAQAAAAADRKALGVKPGEVVDHKAPFVQRYFDGDPAIGEAPGRNLTPAQRAASAADRNRMSPQPRSESNSQGGKMAVYSRQKKRNMDYEMARQDYWPLQ